MGMLSTPGLLSQGGSSGSSSSNYWTLSGANIYNNNIGGVGIGQTAPMAQLHVTPFVQPYAFSAVLHGVGFPTGYAFGSGDKTYLLYGEDDTQPKFTQPIGATFTEPSSTPYDPLPDATPSFNFGASGYIASGYDFGAEVFAMYGSNGGNPNSMVSLGFADTGNSGSDPNDGSSYGVNFSWNAPAAGSPDSYMLVMTGNNPNAGLILFPGSGSTSIIDTNSGWQTDSFPPINYQVSLGWSAAPSPVDNYVLNNSSTNTWVQAGNVLSFIDDNTWSATPITVTPTGFAKVAIFDGPYIDINSVSYAYPATATAGYLFSDGANPANLSFQGVALSSINESVAGQIPYGDPANSGALLQSSKFYFDGANLLLRASLALASNTFGNSGTLNNFNLQGNLSNIYFTNNPILTGILSNGFFGGAILFINASGTTVTLKNDNTGSSATNRIITPNGLDWILTDGQTAVLVWDGNRWRILTWNISTAAGQKLGLFGATPIVQPTTSVAGSSFTANSGTAVNDASTFDGYTLKQVVKALRNLGLLA